MSAFGPSWRRPPPKSMECPCTAYLGPGSAGHYVKMVHNGIEYGLMQMISETYDLMKRGMAYDAQELHRVYQEWSEGDLNGYLMEITAEIFRRKDPDFTGVPLVDMILDRARQKGTGEWTSLAALEHQIPLPTCPCGRDGPGHVRLPEGTDPGGKTV
jgi:6-phosphogluconate dehydrogenase